MPIIIHWDLTARNVLLNSAMVVKIADFGVALIVDLQPDQPEAMGEHANYNSSLDAFSFGNLDPFIFTQ